MCQCADANNVQMFRYTKMPIMQQENFDKQPTFSIFSCVAATIFVEETKKQTKVQRTETLNKLWQRPIRNVISIWSFPLKTGRH